MTQVERLGGVGDKHWLAAAEGRAGLWPDLLFFFSYVLSIKLGFGLYFKVYNLNNILQQIKQ